MITRLKSALLLAPAVLLLLIWIAVCGGSTEVLRMGIPVFLCSAVAIAVTISYCITLYVSSLQKK